MTNQKDFFHYFEKLLMTQMTIFVAVAVLSNTVHGMLLVLNICLYNEIVKLRKLGH